MARKAANMRQRPDGKWELRFTVHGKRYSVYGKSQKECRANELQRRKEIEEKIYIRNNALTLDAYFAEWIQHKAQSVSQNTIGNYSRLYRHHVSPTLGKRRIKDIERREVMQFQEALHRQLSTGTVNLIITMLHQILKAAVYDEVISRNVCDTVKGARKKATEMQARDTIHRALTEKELQIVFKYLQKSPYFNVFRLLLLTGMRVGECCALQWRDIDWKNHVLHIKRTLTANAAGKAVMGYTTKTKKSVRDIPINVDIAKVLHNQRDRYEAMYGGRVQPMDARVFNNERGDILQAASVRAALIRALKKAEKAGESVDHFSIHAFRDTFASMAAQRGVDMNVLKELMGHASLAMTSDLYCHVYEKQKRDAMKEMNLISM